MIYTTVATVQEDGTTTIVLHQIESNGEQTRLYEIEQSSLHEAFSVLGADILDGHVFPEDYPVNFIDGMIVKRGDSLYVRRFDSGQSSWNWVQGFGEHLDKQITEWLMDGSASIEYDPANA